MLIYYITLVLVIILCGMAQLLDSSHEDAIVSNRINHSRPTLGFFLLTAAVLIFVAGFRYNVGTDFGAYYRQYLQSASELIGDLITLDEPGYGIISLLATLIYNDGATAIFLASLITIGLSFCAVYKNTDKLLMAVLLLIFLGCWHVSFNAVRQSLAAAVIFCGFRYLKEGKLIKYFLVVFIAFLFHRSAVLMILPYFIVRKKINIWNLLIVAFVLIIIFISYDKIFIFIEWLLNEQNLLDNMYMTNSVNTLRVLVACAPTVFFLIYYWNKEITSEQSFYLFLLIFHAMVMMMASGSAYLSRMGIYTAPFVAICIPELLKPFSSRSRPIISVGILFAYGFYWLYEISISATLNNFQWIWPYL